MKNTSLCSFRNKEEEPPLHTFRECTSVIYLWQQLATFFENHLILPALTPQTALFGLGPSIKYVRKIFRKTNISTPPDKHTYVSNTLIHTRTCTYQGVRNVTFRKILRTYLMDDPALE